MSRETRKFKIFLNNESRFHKISAISRGCTSAESHLTNQHKHTKCTNFKIRIANSIMLY